MGITKKRTNTKTDKKTKCTNNLYIKKKRRKEKEIEKADAIIHYASFSVCSGHYQY